MKKILFSVMSILLIAMLFTGCGKKKMEDGASDIESKVSDIASDVESGVSSFVSDMMPGSSKTE